MLARRAAPRGLLEHDEANTMRVHHWARDALRARLVGFTTIR
jgi:hypothetical protein